MASEATPAEGTPREAESAIAVSMPGPRGLRLGRAVVGIVLLTLAWGAVMGAFLLVAATLTPLPEHYATSRLMLYAVGIVGALWLAVMALGAIVVGAFCLMLAFTTRQW
jgi:hypothetical protein